MSRYFRTDRNILNALARVETPTWDVRKRRAQVLAALGIAAHDVEDLENDDALMDFAAREGRGWMQESEWHNLSSDAGGSWCALTVGEEYEPGRDRGLHVLDLSPLQLAWIRALASREGFGLETPRYAGNGRTI